MPDADSDTTVPVAVGPGADRVIVDPDPIGLTTNIEWWNAQSHIEVRKDVAAHLLSHSMLMSMNLDTPLEVVQHRTPMGIVTVERRGLSFQAFLDGQLVCKGTFSSN